jgi:hypothetical protein
LDVAEEVRLKPDSTWIFLPAAFRGGPNIRWAEDVTESTATARQLVGEDLVGMAGFEPATP